MIANSIEHISLLSGQSAYGIFDQWQASLQTAFQVEGACATICPIQDEANLPDVPSQATFAFNLIRNWPSPPSKERSHFSWMVDAPPHHGIFFAHSITPMPVNPDRCFVGCVDTHWLAFAQHLYQYKNMSFLPHATSLTAPFPRKKTTYKAVMLGSLQAPEPLFAQLREKAGSSWPIIEALLQQAMQPNSYSLGELMLNTIKALNMPNEQAWVFVNVFYPLIDRYLRNKTRLDLLSIRHPCPIHIFGQGDWNQFDWPKSIVLHKPIPYNQVFELLAETETLINHTPTLRGGAHERIFDALMCGANVLTTPSTFTEQLFESEQAVQIYSTPEELSTALAPPPIPQPITPKLKPSSSLHTPSRTEPATFSKPLLKALNK